MAAIDKIISEYDAILTDIYTKRTAVDYTFTGVLAQFLTEVNSISKGK